ncbi:MAG: aldo/keto reductase [Verrucomicrobiae bacterium]|nr:aldo/keto reductase [Verrucomicrobiae bacterium]
MAHNKMDRRTFIASAGATAAVAATTKLAQAQFNQPGPNVEWRNRKAGMAYRQLGRTNLMVSEIVFGGLTVRNSPEHAKYLQTGIDLGINYIDSASAYNKGDSERGIAPVINTSSKRDRVFLTTKTSMWLKEGRSDPYMRIWETLNVREQARVRAEIGKRIQDQGLFEEYYLCNYGDWQVSEAEKLLRDDVLEDWYGDRVSTAERRGMSQKLIEELDASLQRLGTDHVDILFAAHGATHRKHLECPELLDAVETLKRQGKMRFLSVSAHNDPAAIVKAAADSEYYDMAMVAYNISNESWVAPALEYAKGKGLGIVAMKVARAPFPDRGGKVDPLPGLVEKLNKLVPGDMHIAEKAYTWGLRNPNISACISAMTSDTMVRSNAALVGKSGHSVMG